MSTPKFSIVEGNLQDAAFSTTFNDPDTDVVFRSSDNVLFRIHTKQLESASAGFPPAPFKPGENEVVDLSENSGTLELMFRFVYVRMTPSLEGIDFSELVLLAEAVEKYQIHAGMQMCKLALGFRMSEGPTAVLDHATRHDYRSLANQSARFVSLNDISRVAQQVSPELLRSWVPYFARIMQALHDISTVSSASCVNHHVHRGPNSSDIIIVMCSGWISQRTEILASLMDKATTTGSLDTILSVFTVSRLTPNCCADEIERWRLAAINKLNAVGPFVQE